MASLFGGKRNLVGERPEMKTADAVKTLLEKPYALGGFENSFDCFSMFLTFCDKKGLKMPDEWQAPDKIGTSWTRENYAERWNSGEGRNEMYEFLHTLGEEVEDVNYLREDDIVLLAIDLAEGRGGVIFTMPSIYLGNGHLMLVTLETGVTVLPLWAVKEKIYEIRRLHG